MQTDKTAKIDPIVGLKKCLKTYDSLRSQTGKVGKNYFSQIINISPDQYRANLFLVKNWVERNISYGDFVRNVKEFIKTLNLEEKEGKNIAQNLGEFLEYLTQTQQ